MTARMVFAAALAVSALAAPPALAAPDLSQMPLAASDLPAGTTVLTEGSFPIDKGVREYDRSFKLRPSSGFVRLDSDVVLSQRTSYAKLLFGGARLFARNNADGRQLAKFVAIGLGVKPKRVHVSRPRSLDVGDGGFTYNIRVNGKVPIVVGIFRVDRAVGEIDARGAHGPKGLLARTRGVVRQAAARVREQLSPQPLTPPAITGTAQVGVALQASPGTWSDATSFAYAWQRCDAAGTCSAIAGATQPTYTVTAADAGSTLRIVVTAANSVGPTIAESAPTTTVPAP